MPGNDLSMVNCGSFLPETGPMCPRRWKEGIMTDSLMGGLSLRKKPLCLSLSLPAVCQSSGTVRQQHRADVVSSLITVDLGDMEL